MKKYIFGAVFSLALLASPTFTQAAALTSTQISAIVGLLQSFGADAATIANVQASLTGGTPTGGGTQQWCYNFGTDLTIGSGGADVAALRQALGLSGITPTTSDTFDETTAGYVVQFQAKYGIRQTGYVGPITRAKLNSLYGCNTTPSNISLSPSSGPVGTTVTINGSGFSKDDVVYFQQGQPVSAVKHRNSPDPSNITSLSFVVPNTSGQCVPQTNGSSCEVRVTNAISLIGRTAMFHVTSDVTTQPSITVLSPNGGENFQIGSTQFITWAPKDFGKTYGISLTDANGFGQGTIATVAGIAADRQSYSWNIGQVTVASDRGDMAKVIIPGVYKIQIVNTETGLFDSSDALFSIVAGTVTTTSVPTVEFIGTPTLGLQYDSAGKEAVLVGNATYKITAGNSAVSFDMNENHVMSPYVLSCNGNCNGNWAINGPAIIQAGQSATYTATLTANPKIMFAGTYSLQTMNLGYAVNGQWQNLFPSSFINAHPSNSVTIVGETSPYITSAWSDLAGNATMKGVRFGNQGSNIATMISLNGQVINSSANTNNGYYIVNYVDGVGHINFRPADFGITTSGYYPVQIINSSTGDSNRVTLNYTAPTTTGATPITLSSIIPSSGPVGTSIRLDGCGSDSSSGFTLVYTGPKSGTATIPVETLGAASGCGYMTLTVPTDFPTGTYTLSVKNNQTGAMSTNSMAFTVTSNFYLATLSISPTSFVAGSPATITVANAAPNATVKVFCRDPNNAVCDDSATYTTDASGWFTHTYDTTGWTVGTYRGWVTGNSANPFWSWRSIDVGFTVTAPVVANNPVASISPTSFAAGATVTSSVSGAAPNATIHIFSTGPDGVTSEDTPGTTNASGAFSRTYNTTGWATGSYYRGWVTVNGVQSNVVTFTVTAPTTGGTTGGPYILTDPASGINLPSGSAQTIRWTGGDSGAVTLYLIDIARNVVASVIASSAPNTGSFNWTIPTTFFGQSRVYIQCTSCSPLNYAYGPLFNISNLLVSAATPNPGLASALSAFNGATGAMNPVSQSADNKSTSNFTYIWNRDLQIGSPYFDDVTALQKALTLNGEYAGEITGGFYNQTYAAVRAFQEKYGINQTGYVGSLTRTQLNTLYSQ